MNMESFMPDFMPENSPQSTLESMKNAAILVVGDIMLDRFVYGAVDRISPESPVPVLSIKREERMLGGAGNTLANLAGLGTLAQIISVVGDDEEATEVRSEIEKLGFKSDDLVVDASRPTTIKTRFLSGHQQLLRTDFEDNTEINDETAKAVIQNAGAAIKNVQAVILSDYGKGLLRDDIIAEIIAAAKSKNIPVIVDPKGQDFSIYRGASVITPNKKELSEATKGAPVSTDQEVEAASQKLIAEDGIDAVIATRSADGISVIQKGEAPVHIPTKDIEVFDVSGAGDSVIATISAALAADADLPEAAQLANIAGSIVVTKVGTAPIRADELAAALSESSAAVISTQEAAEQIKRWKARGLKTGFTNGCFDILHFGHVSYLKEARAHCDRLIVGLNSDSSVRILKGDDRPVHDETSRSAVLGALESVDMVVLFGAEKDGDDNTAIALLESLKPDIYFKGGDYTEDQIPEAPTVKSNGGEVKIMPVYEGHSTTNSIAKSKTQAA